MVIQIYPIYTTFNVSSFPANTIQTPNPSSSIETEDFSSYTHATTGSNIIPFINDYHGYGSGYYCDQRVIDGPYGDHYKVLYVRDAQGSLNTWSMHHLNDPLFHGKIEFSLYLNPGSSCTNPHYHYLKFRALNNDIAFEFRFNLKNGAVEYTDGSSYSSNVLNLQEKMWYRYEISLDASVGNYDLTCTEEVSQNQVEFIENIKFKNFVAIEEMYIGTNVGDYSGNSRWDDFWFEEIDPNRGPGIFKEAPAQWPDFNFNPYGSEIEAGNLLEDDTDTMIVSSESYYGYGTETYKGFINPNADILTQWNDADPPSHWSRLDEATGDMNGDDGNIRESHVSSRDKWHFSTLPLSPNEFVTKLIYWVYIKEQSATTSTFVDIDSSVSTSGIWSATGTDYQWISYTKSGLWLSQSDLDSFWLQVELADIPSWMEEWDPGWVDINTVYVEVYVIEENTQYLHDWTVLWDVTDVDLSLIDELFYKYQATSNIVTTYTEIRNFNTGYWDLLESNTGTEWVEDSFVLESVHISENDQVELRFSTTTSLSSFDLVFDQLYLTYFTTEGMEDLIGGYQRFFPQKLSARLGYTLFSHGILGTPQLELSITDTSPDDNDIIDIKLFIDSNEIWSTTMDIEGTELLLIDANELIPRGTHQIVIELSDGGGYFLEHLKINDLHFTESELYKGFYYTPAMFYQYGEEYDEAFISFDMKTEFVDDTLQLNTHTYTWRPAMMFFINPDIEDDDWGDFGGDYEKHNYYIESHSMQWRILDPSGQYLEETPDSPPYTSIGGEQSWVGVTEGALIEDQFDELEFLWYNIEKTGISLILNDYLQVPFEILMALLETLFALNYEEYPIPDRIDKDQIGDDSYKITWNAGRDDPPFSHEVPLPQFTEASMLTNYETDLSIGSTGTYQLEVIWSMEIYDIYGFREWRDDITPAQWVETWSLIHVATLSDSYYVNFEYV
ncbi:MAG: hypothetical protein ACFE96_08060 [Candidatus Hermodarchaeota archaeon]